MTQVETETHTAYSEEIQQLRANVDSLRSEVQSMERQKRSADDARVRLEKVRGGGT